MLSLFFLSNFNMGFFFYQRIDSVLVCFFHERGLLVSSLCLRITSCPIICFDNYVFVSACRVIIEFPSMVDNVT